MKDITNADAIKNILLICDWLDGPWPVQPIANQQYILSRVAAREKFAHGVS